jgi:hypothetical protein
MGVRPERAGRLFATGGRPFFAPSAPGFMHRSRSGNRAPSSSILPPRSSTIHPRSSILHHPSSPKTVATTVRRPPWSRCSLR